MKVIDLLNRIANEEVRHDIKINTRYYYCSIEEYLKEFGINEDTLNVEVIGFDDIIEEDKKIEKLIIGKDDIAWCEGNMKTDEEMVDIVLEIKDKINEIIDKLNKENK